MTTSNPNTIVNACDNQGNYILFNTSSSQKTRAWSRAETSGRLYCCSDVSGSCVNGKLLSEKRKYVVLRYENNNNQGPGHQRGTLESNRIGRFASGLVNRNLTRNLGNTIRIGNVNYGIPARIKAIITKYQEEGVIPESITIDQLKEYIALIRELIEEKADIGVRLKNVPLSQYKARYIYSAGGNKWPTGSQDQPVYLAPKNFSVPFKLTDYALTANIIDIIMGGVHNIPPEAVLNGTFSTGRAQYLQAIRNDACGYTGAMDDFLPATTEEAARRSASVWGTRIINPNRFSTTNLDNLGLYNFVVMRPANAQRYGGKYQTRVGIIIVINGDFLIKHRDKLISYISIVCSNCGDPTAPCLVPGVQSAVIDMLIDCVSKFAARNSDFLFVPIETNIDKLTNPQLPPNTSVTFPRSMNYDLTPANVATFNAQINALLSGRKDISGEVRYQNASDSH